MKKWLLLLLLIPLVVWAADPVEPKSGARVTITQDHAEIHAGNSFSTFCENAVTNTDEQTVIAFTTPPATDERMHLIATAYSSDESVFVIYEAPTITLALGTREQAPFNRLRESANTATMLSLDNPQLAGEVSVYEESDATDLSSGDTIYSESLGGSGFTPVSGVAGESRGLREFVLAPATKYAFELTASTDNDTIHRIQLDWYEHSITNSTTWYEQ